MCVRNHVNYAIPYTKPIQAKLYYWTQPMTHESLVSPHSVEQLSPFYKVLRLRPLGMVGLAPTTQIPLTVELHPLMETIIEVCSCPFGLVKMKGFEPLTRRLKACCSTNWATSPYKIVPDKHRGEKMLEYSAYVHCSRINYWHFLFSLHNRTYHLILFRITHLQTAISRLSYSHRIYN